MEHIQWHKDTTNSQKSGSISSAKSMNGDYYDYDYNSNGYYDENSYFGLDEFGEYEGYVNEYGDYIIDEFWNGLDGTKWVVTNEYTTDLNDIWKESNQYGLVSAAAAENENEMKTEESKTSSTSTGSTKSASQTSMSSGTNPQNVHTDAERQLSSKCMLVFGRNVCLCEFINWVYDHSGTNPLYRCYSSGPPPYQQSNFQQQPQQPLGQQQPNYQQPPPGVGTPATGTATATAATAASATSQAATAPNPNTGATNNDVLTKIPEIQASMSQVRQQLDELLAKTNSNNGQTSTKTTNEGWQAKVADYDDDDGEYDGYYYYQDEDDEDEDLYMKGMINFIQEMYLKRIWRIWIWMRMRMKMMKDFGMHIVIFKINLMMQWRVGRNNKMMDTIMMTIQWRN